MNVALLLYGQPRFVNDPEIIRSYQRTILRPYNPHVFTHAWFEPGATYDYSSWSTLTHHHVPDNAIESIKETFSPRTSNWDIPYRFHQSKSTNLDRFKGNPLYTETNFSNMVSQLYSIQKVADLLYLSMMNTKIKYDWIILGRYDTTFHDFPKLRNLDNSKTFIPDVHRGFPDMVVVMGGKFLSFLRNVYFDIPEVAQRVMEPTPEEFKRLSFLKRFDQSDIVYYPMRAYAKRA